jgi:phospholipase C
MSSIEHIFVLVLENHSFDHILGYSNISGTDAVTKTPTKIDSLVDKSCSNTYQGITYPTSPDAENKMSVDPPHEFIDVFKQIAGEDAVYDKKTQYNVPKDMSGFVYEYVNTPSRGEGHPIGNYGDIMRCYDTQRQLPVTYSLATEFVVCDNWFCSMPGPTWPNRLFLQGASSCGLDDSPSNLDILKWNVLEGIEFKNGTIYDALDKKKIPWKIYGGAKSPIEGSIPMVAALKGITLDKWSSFDSFAKDLHNDFKPAYVYLEPNYGNTIDGTYSGGNSQHPMDNIQNGEVLIKTVYEAIRNSPIWESTILIISYDESGGFYESKIPPKTIAPGDGSKYSVHGFDFTQLGMRVPTLIISPLIQANLIDHTIYDHTSILATVERLFGIPPLTRRDANANDFLHLFKLKEPRLTPFTLPEVDYDSDDDEREDFLERKNSLSSEPELDDVLERNKKLPDRGNIHGLQFISQKISHELGLKYNTTNTVEEFRDAFNLTVAGIEKYRTKPKRQECCTVS